VGGRWDDVEDLLVEMAGHDLAGCDEVNPALAAWRGSNMCFLAFLRPFAKGAYRQPLIELLALAVPLGADRLALSMGARAWSLNDPIPPVSADGDLRQRILVIEAVDAAGGDPQRRTVVVPFEVRETAVIWGPRASQEVSVGWLGEALCSAVGPAMRSALRSGDADIARQARRVVELGHDLYLDLDVAERLLAATEPS
jgi:hypothetical protein